MPKLLSGFQGAVLEESLLYLQTRPDHFAACFSTFLPFLSRPLSSQISKAFAAAFGAFAEADLRLLPNVLREIAKVEPVFPKSLNTAIQISEKNALETLELPAFNTSFTRLRSEHFPEASLKLSPQDSARRNFFEVAMKSKSPSPDAANDEFWGQLTNAWQNPKEKLLPALATSSRAAPKIFQYCYILTLGRFEGMDEAALKILDFIRSEEESVLRAAVHALAKINTPRSSQELINAMTRPNATLGIQLEICSILKEKNLSALQPEIRSTYADLIDSYQIKDEQYLALRDALTELITPNTVAAENSLIAGAEDKNQAFDEDISRDLDKKLTAKIPNYRSLSAEVRRSLRTAQFFDDIMPKSATVGSIDISPVIDMQYKSLELLFRESFEEVASRKIEIGMLQHKLDVIGYARPIPSAMDEFENYIERLPVICKIPFSANLNFEKCYAQFVSFALVADLHSMGSKRLRYSSFVFHVMNANSV